MSRSHRPRPNASTSPTRLGGLTLLVASMVVAPLAGCRRSAHEGPDEGSGVAAAPQGAAGIARPLVPSPVTARRPDAWLRALPTGPSIVAALDVATLFELVVTGPWNLFGLSQDQYAVTLRDWLAKPSQSEDWKALLGALKLERLSTLVVAMWGGDGESLVVMVNPEALAAAPAEGAAPVPLAGSSLQVAQRGGRLAIGAGPAFQQIAAGAIPKTFEPAAVWPAGWSAVGDNAALTLWVDEPGRLPPAYRDSFATMTARGASRIAVSVATDGSASAAVDAATPVLAAELGRAQAWGRTLLTAQGATATEATRPWLAYAGLVYDSLWSRVTLETEGSTSRVRVAPPQCGSAINNIPVIAVLATLLQKAGPAGAPDAAFVPPKVSLSAACKGLPGPAPALPRSLAQVATPPTGGAVLALFDTSALLRANLPSFFGLLPYALDAGEIRRVLGEHPLGLSALDASDGSGALYLEQSAGGGGFIIAHPGFADLSFMQRFKGQTDARQVPGLGFVASSPGFPVELRRQGAADASSPWVRLAEALPADAVLSIGVSRTYIAALVGQFARSDLQSALGQAQALALSLGATMDPTITYVVPSGAEAAAGQVKAALAKLVEEQSRQANAQSADGSGGTSADLAAMLEVTHVGDTGVQVRMLRGGSMLMAAGAALAWPIMAKVTATTRALSGSRGGTQGPAAPAQQPGAPAAPR